MNLYNFLSSFLPSLIAPLFGEKQRKDQRDNQISDKLKDIAVSLPPEEAIRQIEIVGFDLTDQKRKLVEERLLPILQKTKQTCSDDSIDDIASLFNKFFNTSPQEIRDLLVRAMKGIANNENLISRATVLFLLTLDKRSLDILKEQFRYIIPGTTTIALFGYNYFKGTSILEYNGTLRFLGSIWDANSRQAIPPIPEKSIIHKSKTLTLTLTTDPVLAITLNRYWLTDVGFEIYQLLKDDIDKLVPDEYIAALRDYLSVISTGMIGDYFIITENPEPQNCPQNQSS